MSKHIELSEKRIETSRKTIANCLNKLENVAQELKWACEAEQWNDDIAYLVEEASLKLGYVLAALSTWNDPIDEK
jgi:hypothetical protein